MTKRTHRRKGVSEPLVSIDGLALRQALAARKLTVRGAAKQIDVTSQTLQYVVAGIQRRVRLSVFQRLVTLLRGRLSPTEFRRLLRGEKALVARPLVTGTDADKHIRAAGDRDTTDIELIADRAFRTVLQDAEELWLGVLPGPPEQATAGVQFFYSPIHWRRALFGDQAGPTLPEEVDAAAVAASAFWRVVFRPLLDNTVSVRPNASRELAAVAQQVFTEHRSTPRRRKS